MEPRAPQVAEQLLLIERELRALGWWVGVSPSAEALASQAPFCVDTLAFDQWLQWVFLPRMNVILKDGTALPQASGIRAMAEEVFRDGLAEVSGLLDALGTFDRLIGGMSE